MSDVDEDGNEVGGIRLPSISVPLATNTGWNLRHPDNGNPGLVIGITGGLAGWTLPFHITKEEKEAAGDPRRSIEERYESRDDYVERVRQAAEELVSEGYLLEEDVERESESAGGAIRLLDERGVSRVSMNAVSKQIGKNGVLGLLDDLNAEGCIASALISAGTLAERESAHRLLELDLESSIAAQVIEVAGNSDTGVAIFIGTERIVAVQPPVPLTTDARASGMLSEPLRELLRSSPVIGVVLLRLGRYAIGRTSR